MMQSRCNLVMETTWHYEIVQKIRSQHYAAFNLDSDEVNNVLGFRPRFPGSISSSNKTFVFHNIFVGFGSPC